MKSFLFGSSFLLLIISSPLFCAKKHPQLLLEDPHYSNERKVKKELRSPLSKKRLSRKSDNIIWSEDFENNADGWSFNSDFENANGDTLYNKKYLYEIYQLCSDKISTKVTVPILWDKNTQQIVNNESSEILRIFNSSL